MATENDRLPHGGETVTISFMHRFFFGIASLALAACFSNTTNPVDDAGSDAGADTSKPLDAGNVVEAGTETWQDGKTIDGDVVIPSGATVTIAPGATITVGTSVTIRVEGALVCASASPTHATLTGTNWQGIQVAVHGVVTLDGLDVTNATTALDVSGDGKNTYDHGIITNATPFVLATASTLSTTSSKVVKPAGITQVSGSFTASYLDYDSNDHGAIVTLDKTAVLSMEDSTIHNSGPMGKATAPDQLTDNGAATFHVAYSDISGSHCGFHFDQASVFDIDHVTVHDVTNGADLWGTSSSGTRTIKSSNWQSLTENFDETNTNGVISVDGCYTTGTNKLKDAQVQITNPASVAVTGAGPR